MLPRVNPWLRSLASLILGASTALPLVVGCNKNDNSQGAQAKDSKGTEIAVQNKKDVENPNPTVPQPMCFLDAVTLEAPPGVQRPPDKTMAGTSVPKIYEEIAGKEGGVGLWDQIRFATPDGKRLRYTAHLKTDLGTIEITLLDHVAPNHVRNFIALAKAGYFDGLPFHHSFRKEVEGQTVGFLEGGCPLGTGAAGYGSIGYWLKPEISDLTHEEGTVGAWYVENPNSAACKFYITLNRAQGMDGSYTIFGKITKGLDVAHTINKRPVHDDGDDLNDRPKEPVFMRAVTIQAVVE